MPTITEIEKQVPATTESKEQAWTPAPRPAARRPRVAFSPADEDARFFSEEATQNASCCPANSTLAQIPNAPIPAEVVEKESSAPRKSASRRRSPAPTSQAPELSLILPEGEQNAQQTGLETTSGSDAGCTPSVDLDDPTIISAINKQASVLENVFFPAQMLAALGLGETGSITAARIFLARFRKEAGQAGDAVEQVLLDQLAHAHLKVGELYARAESASNIEFKQMYNGAAVRLLGAICQLVSTLSSYRASASKRNKRAQRSPVSDTQQESNSTEESR